MASYAKSDMGFGLVRALSRVRPGRPMPRNAENTPSHEREAFPEMQPVARLSSEASSREAEQSRSLHAGLELWPLPGLAPMTRVRTSFGDVHAIALRKGDKVLLKSGEYKAIQWINRIVARLAWTRRADNRDDGVAAADLLRR